MNAYTIKYLVATALVVGACQTTTQTTNTTKPAQTATDTITITESVIEQGARLNPESNPISRSDVQQFSNSERPDYRIDTLATIDSLAVVLISRLYSNERIGWLATFGHTDKRLLDKIQVYYDNAEGMTQTETNWLPAYRKAIVQTGTYDEAGQYKIDKVTYQLTPAGKFVRQ